MALLRQTGCTRLHQQQASQLSPAINSTRRSVQRLAVSCSAGSLVSEASVSTGLATYAWPKANKLVRQQPVTRSPTKLWSTQMWFEAMVQTVVKQLDGSPFLLRVGVNPVLSLQLIRLDAADLAAGWDHIQQRHLDTALHQDEAVILVHAVATEDTPCVVHQVAGQACPGCPHSTDHTAAAAAAYAASTAELLNGRFGECCSGDDHDHSHNHHHHQHSSSAHQHQPQQQQVKQEHPETLTSFYGMVVQTRNAADPLQGCYLLKTVKQSSSSGSACHCTHYSLNQVCKGPSLQQQYQASWLV